mgnify:FL=1
MMTDLLLVEDNQDCRTTVAAILRLQGFEVTEAEDGPDALFLAKTLAPTLIICDVSLPTMSGFDVKRELNKEKELSSIPFVFMTGHTDRKTFRTGMELGALDYLTKPFKAKELVSMIESVQKNHEYVPKVGREWVDGLNVSYLSHPDNWE